MRRIIVGMLLFFGILAAATATLGTNGTGVSPARQWAIINFANTTKVAGFVLTAGQYLIAHDSDKMARGEPCTSIYRFGESGLGPQQELVAFHCIPRNRPVADHTRLATETVSGMVDKLTEFQFAGDAEGHGVPETSAQHEGHAVGIEEYKGQQIFIVGEVRKPGAYPLSEGMRLAEVLALAGSTLPTASVEAVIVHASKGPDNVVRLNLRDLENGVLSQNVVLLGGDTIFVPRAENVFVCCEVRNPGSYPLQPNTTVLQALSLAGGVTDRAWTTRINIIRIVNGQRQEFKVKLTDVVRPGDTIVVPERFF